MFVPSLRPAPTPTPPLQRRMWLASQQRALRSIPGLLVGRLPATLLDLDSDSDDNAMAITAAPAAAFVDGSQVLMTEWEAYERHARDRSLAASRDAQVMAPLAKALPKDQPRALTNCNPHPFPLGIQLRALFQNPAPPVGLDLLVAGKIARTAWQPRRRAFRWAGVVVTDGSGDDRTQRWATEALSAHAAPAVGSVLPHADGYVVAARSDDAAGVLHASVHALHDNDAALAVLVRHHTWSHGSKVGRGHRSSVETIASRVD